MRKTTRQAVIFALWGSILFSVGIFGLVDSWGRPEDFITNVFITGITGAITGFFGGFCIWVFYRIVRFAVKG